METRYRIALTVKWKTDVFEITEDDINLVLK